MEQIEKYLEKHKYKRQLDKLSRKLKNKKVLIYGYGSMFRFIESKYDMTKFNIVGIVDKRFSSSSNTVFSEVYECIKIEDINKIDWDCLIVALEKFIFVLEDLEKLTGKEVFPLIDKSFWELLRDVFYI